MATVGRGRRLAILIDTETTGLDPNSDVIVEIAAVAITYDDDGLHDVVGTFEGLKDPGRPLDPSVARLTGLNDADLVGRSIDLWKLERFLEPASLIVAHNAAFDRPFCEMLSPIFANRAWACSMAEVDWQARGARGRTLGQLLRDVGFFHASHRALTDVHALDRILREHATSGETAFSEMLRKARSTTIEISAVGAPYSARSTLKARGYRWSDGTDGREKAWWSSVGEGEEDAECRWLRSVLPSLSDPVLTRRTAYGRYRALTGEKDS